MQDGHTPLFVACDDACNWGRMEVVKLLLAHPNVDVNQENLVREGRGW